MPQKQTVRLAVVGAGTMGIRHLQAIEAVPDCQAAALADPSPSVGPVAERWGLRAFADTESMLDSVEPDGVIVASPNALHVSQALACVGRGLPVLVEKPIADDLDAAIGLAEASERAGVPVLVGHHRRHNPIVRKARELVHDGALGTLVAVSATWLARKPDDYFETAWRREPGGGPVLINLIHDIDSLRFIAGEIAAVQGVTSSARRGFRVEDTAAVLLRFRDGALGTVILSDAVASPWSWELTAGERTSYSYPRTGEDCYRLAGTEASLGVPSLRLWRHEGVQSWQSPLPESRLEVVEADPLVTQLAHFAEVIRGGTEPLITARDATRSLEATLAVARAAASGGEIELSV